MFSIGHLAVRHLRSFRAAAAGVIGNCPNGAGTTPFGAYDEIRIRKCVSTPDWVKAEYDSITDASFLSSTGARTVGQPGLVLIVR